MDGRRRARRTRGQEARRRERKKDGEAPSTADEAVAEAASTADEVVAKAASTVDRVHGGRGRGRGRIRTGGRGRGRGRIWAPPRRWCFLAVVACPPSPRWEFPGDVPRAARPPPDARSLFCAAIALRKIRRDDGSRGKEEDVKRLATAMARICVGCFGRRRGRRRDAHFAFGTSPRARPWFLAPLSVRARSRSLFTLFRKERSGHGHVSCWIVERSPTSNGNRTREASRGLSSLGRPPRRLVCVRTRLPSFVAPWRDRLDRLVVRRSPQPRPV